VAGFRRPRHNPVPRWPHRGGLFPRRAVGYRRCSRPRQCPGRDPSAVAARPARRRRDADRRDWSVVTPRRLSELEKGERRRAWLRTGAVLALAWVVLIGVYYLVPAGLLPARHAGAHPGAVFRRHNLLHGRIRRHHAKDRPGPDHREHPDAARPGHHRSRGPPAPQRRPGRPGPSAGLLGSVLMPALLIRHYSSAARPATTIALPPAAPVAPRGRVQHGSAIPTLLRAHRRRVQPCHPRLHGRAEGWLHNRAALSRRVGWLARTIAIVAGTCGDGSHGFHTRSCCSSSARSAAMARAV